MKNVFNALIIFSVLLIHGFGNEAKADDELMPLKRTIQYTTIHEQYYLENGSFSNKGSKVFSSQESYQTELLNYSSNQPLSLDFSKSKVLLIDMGTRNSGGYGIEIAGLKDFDDYVLVSIVYIKPGLGCVVTYALTNPFKFIKIETTKEILIKEKNETRKCT